MPVFSKGIDVSSIFYLDTRVRSAGISANSTWYDDNQADPLVVGIDGIMNIWSTKNSAIRANLWDTRIYEAATYSNYGDYNPVIAGVGYQVRTMGGAATGAIFNGEFVGAQFKIILNGGTFNNKIAGFEINPIIYTAGTINSDVYGGRIGNQGNAAWTNSYGLYLDAQTGSTNSYSIYSAGGANYFGGSLTANSLVKIGGTSSQFLKADGSVDSSTYIATVKHSVGFTVDGGGSAISTGKVKGFFTCPYAGNITAWNIVVDTGTVTVKVWKIASGTAKPTSANSINTSGVALSSNTAIHSTTLTDFTSTVVTANDIFAFNIETVASVTEMTFNLEITQ